MRLITKLKVIAAAFVGAVLFGAAFPAMIPFRITPSDSECILEPFGFSLHWPTGPVSHAPHCIMPYGGLVFVGALVASYVAAGFIGVAIWRSPNGGWVGKTIAIVLVLVPVIGPLMWVVNHLGATDGQ
ncbi:MAG: hypothetical protein A2289_06925 [Deltaproteobacteria bacterium RIFOXYA12_FULL_58_15]|nr:MAG: hypothetical protein A2289_06925 [Deltaproteobacteria bacterium RIFOXYA12_FULL_58_15]OGR14402.1 MAG: hypothetical protein A2341_04605 [Deltaproteobacteria bacterium RIFOXYB12_FULL_58_9]